MSTREEVRTRIADGVVIDRKSGCWIWQGQKDRDGYGSINVGRTRRAHRVSYEAHRGSIPTGMDLDHIVCDTPACVNPWHVEPRTRWQNTQRGTSPTAINARKTHCIRGHEFTPENTCITAGRRQCRKCNLAAVKAYQQRKRGAA